MKYSGIKWIGDIPNNWEIRKVKQCFFISKEQAHMDNPVILSLARAGVKIRDISNNEGQLAASYDNYNPVIPGDLLLNPMDLYSGANCSLSEVSGVISPAYINLRKIIELEPKFYDYYFKTQYWTMAMFAHGKGVSFDNRWTMNAESVLNYYLPVPPVVEQKAIVDIINKKINDIDSLIEVVNKQIDNLIEYKQAVITETVTKGLDKNALFKDSGVEWIGKIPYHWLCSKIKKITENHLQGYYDSEGYSDSGYRLLRITDLLDDGSYSIDKSPYVKYTNSIPQFLLKNGDFCFARTGGAGNFAYITELKEQSVFASYLIRFRFKGQNNAFLKYYFLSYIFQREIDTSIHGAVNHNVHADNILETRIAIPPLNEQNKIVEYLDKKCENINKLISIKKQKIEKLEEYKKSLIYEYVTGKKQVVS